MKKPGDALAYFFQLPYTLWVAGGDGPAGNGEDDPFENERRRMVRDQIERRGIEDTRVLEAMEQVPRHLFVPAGDQASAYDDYPLPIGHGQTISQPYIVALMTEALHIGPKDRVLEIGTGSGYQTAILSILAKEVFSIEVVGPLHQVARRRLETMGCENVRVAIGDGNDGWPDAAPFDCIIATAAPDAVPPSLIAQLAQGGRMVIPVGLAHQELFIIRREGKRILEEKIANVRFVPMIRGDDG
jgi:protein-L-isoaspartate(D-aspartate) O-methyltransferase